MNEKKKKICFTLQAQALEFVVTSILGNGSERGKKESPKDTGIGDGVGLHCGRDHGAQALPQEESSQLSNAALASCVCATPSNWSGQPDQQTPEGSVRHERHSQTIKTWGNRLPSEKKHYQTFDTQPKLPT